MMILRAALAAALTLGLLLAPLAAEVQPAAGVHRIGYLSPGFPSTDTNPSQIVVAFRARLAELAHIEVICLTRGDLRGPLLNWPRRRST